tara:strand:+ start:179 stop:376 length:198 start_codon:yes stop_codon:yes gene_type:complete
MCPLSSPPFNLSYFCPSILLCAVFLRMIWVTRGAGSSQGHSSATALSHNSGKLKKSEIEEAREGR